MSLAESVRSEVPMSQARTMPAAVNVLVAVLVAAFVVTSCLISFLPEFRFQSQFPALLPFFVWVAAVGVGDLANRGRALLEPWRAAFGLVSVVPYVVLMLVSATVPALVLPWWLALVAAAAAAVPFLLLAVRTTERGWPVPSEPTTDAGLRGTFLVAVALMLVAYAVAGPAVAGAILSVLIAVALGVTSMMSHGLARAWRTWRPAHWLALAWGSLVIWASVLLHGMTSFFADTWFVFTAVVLAGVPLALVNRTQAGPARRV